MQLVHVVERGERAQMSKRKGEFVTLDDLIDDIGVDAARFFMLQRSPRHAARHRPRPGARAESGEPCLLRPIRARPHREHPAPTRAPSAWPSCGARRPRQPLGPAGAGRASADQAPAGAARTRCARPPSAGLRTASRAYAREVAADFHAFYRDCRVVGAEAPELEELRISLCLATQGSDRPRAGPARGLGTGADVAAPARPSCGLAALRGLAGVDHPQLAPVDAAFDVELVDRPVDAGVKDAGAGVLGVRTQGSAKPEAGVAGPRLDRKDLQRFVGRVAEVEAVVTIARRMGSLPRRVGASRSSVM